jgi:hypothetical protein
LPGKRLACRSGATEVHSLVGRGAEIVSGVGRQISSIALKLIALAITAKDRRTEQAANVNFEPSQRRLSIGGALAARAPHVLGDRGRASPPAGGPAPG